MVMKSNSVYIFGNYVLNKRQFSDEFSSLDDATSVTILLVGKLLNSKNYFKIFFPQKNYNLKIKVSLPKQKPSYTSQAKI